MLLSSTQNDTFHFNLVYANEYTKSAVVEHVGLYFLKF